MLTNRVFKMKTLAAFLIFGGVVLLQANPIVPESGARSLEERHLLGGILGGLLGGGGGGAEADLNAGLLGGLLGGGGAEADAGLVGGLLNTLDSITGGLLGGGSSGGDLDVNLSGNIGSKGLGLLGGLLGPGSGLLSGLLGGGSNNTGLLGGTLNGIIGPNGLLGGGLLGGLSGKGSILGGLTGEKGLLGGLTGEKGLLGGLLSGKGGLLGGLTGGVLGNVLGGKGGLLGDVLGIVNKLFCLLHHMGLGFVTEVLQNLKADTLLGLNTVCTHPNGGDLLSILFKNGTNLRIVDEVVCLTKAIGVKPVLDLVSKMGGVNKILPFLNANCSESLLFSSNSTVPAILTKLLSAFNLSTLVEVDLRVFIELAKYLEMANIADIPKFISQTACLLEKLGKNLKFFVEVIKELGVNIVLNISINDCKAGQPLFDNLVRLTGLPIQTVLKLYGCQIKVLGIEFVEAQIKQNQLKNLENLNTLCRAPFFNPTSPFVRFVVELALVSGIDVTASLNVSNIQKLDKIISSLNILDFKTLIEKYSCGIKMWGPVKAILALEVVGLSTAISLSNKFCDAGNGMSSSNSLKILLQSVDVDIALALLTQLGFDFFVKLANFIVVNGKFQGIELLNRILCVLETIGVQSLEDIFKKTSPSNFLDVYTYFCPNGKPLILEAKAQAFGQAVIDCRTGFTSQCESSLESGASVSCDGDCQGGCKSLPVGKQAKSYCFSACLSNCQGGK